MYYDTNILAILGASLGAIIWSGLWYSPKFMGTLYKKLSKTSESTANLSKKEMQMGYAGTFLMNMLTASALYFILLVTRATTLGQLMTVAFLVWAGFYLSSIVTNGLWRKHSVKLMFIEAFHFLCAIVIMTFLIVIIA